MVAVPSLWTHKHLSLGQAAKSGSGCLEESGFSPHYHFNPGRDGKGTGKKDVSWCHLKLHTKLERKRQNQHSQSWVCGMQRARLKFPTLFSTEIVPLTFIPLSGNLQDLSSHPLYIALEDAHRKQKSVNCCATPCVIFLNGISPLNLYNINCSLTFLFQFLVDN